jgi:hypothetical protein
MNKESFSLMCPFSVDSEGKCETSVQLTKRDPVCSQEFTHFTSKCQYLNMASTSVLAVGNFQYFKDLLADDDWHVSKFRHVVIYGIGFGAQSKYPL